MSKAQQELKHRAPPEAWLALRREEALEPELPIIDAHHHLWDRIGHRYLLDEYRRDISESGHDVRASVYVQARSMYRASGPQHEAPVGETEFANGTAVSSERDSNGQLRICAGIVGFADLRLGGDVQPVLEAHVRVGGDRFRGIRHIATWDADSSVMNPTIPTSPRLLADPAFRRGAASLARMGLSFDVWVFHPQLRDVIELADALPGLRIVLNHMGGVLNIHSYAGRRDEAMAAWERDLAELARRPNVFVKLGGLGMHISGFDYAGQPRPPSSEEVCRHWTPYIRRCIDLFGPDRCMFESNFPVDKSSMSYGVFWNACKRIAASYTDREKIQLFHNTALRAYRLHGIEEIVV